MDLMTSYVGGWDRKMTDGKKWSELTPEEKKESRFKRWLLPSGVEFKSKEAEDGYKRRVTRFIKTIKLEEPDRVPVMLPAGFYAAYHAGGNLKKVMYDYDELKRAYIKFLNDFEMDSFMGPGLVIPGKVLEDIDYKIHHWPGHGLPDNTPLYQYIEGEYMKPDEYDAFSHDPTDYLLRKFLPRSVGAFTGFSKLSQMTPFIGIPVFWINQFSDPDIRASVQALLDAAEEGAKWQAAVIEVGKIALESGIPGIAGGMSGAPFDLMGDMLRGTKGIMMDMYQRPEKLIEAMERITPIIINEAVRSANVTGNPVIIMPLHKGTGGFMSDEQFKKFYWPTFKEVMMGLIDEGLVPLPFAEGDYNPRLEVIKDMPRASVIWYFETVDMTRAKKVLGDNACIAGNLPVSLMCTGKPEEVKEGCKRLIETCAKGGGYILTASASMNQGNGENLRAMMEAAKEYGRY